MSEGKTMAAPAPDQRQDHRDARHLPWRNAGTL